MFHCADCGRDFQRPNTLAIHRKHRHPEAGPSAPEGTEASPVDGAAVMRIESFTGRNRFLSNFFPAEVEYGGTVYATVEHAFQAAKTAVEDEREGIRMAPTPGKAKALGRKVSLRDDWEAVKEGIMEGLVLQKFTRHRTLAAELLDTGDAELVEGNGWGDAVWGMVKRGGKWTGRNLLGGILMRVRERLRRG